MFHWKCDTSANVLTVAEFPVDKLFLTSTEDDYVANSPGTKGFVQCVILEEPT